ncbi:MAG: hypothetical protein R3A52_09100, partial [Polyangiales bacterium]
MTLAPPTSPTAPRRAFRLGLAAWACVAGCELPATVGRLAPDVVEVDVPAAVDIPASFDVPPS